MDYNVCVSADCFAEVSIENPKIDLSMQKILRLLQLNLFEKRQLKDLLDQDKHGKPNINDHQPSLLWKLTGHQCSYIFNFDVHTYNKHYITPRPWSQTIITMGVYVRFVFIALQ